MLTKVIKVNSAPKIKTTHYHGGKVESQTPYVNGKKHGAEIRWHEDGTKIIEGMWNSGKRHGVETLWDEDGTKRWEEIWKNDKHHGIWTEWYENRTKSHEETWMNGKRHGVETGWYEDGKIKYKIYYFHDEDYARIHWDEEGNITKVKKPTYSPPINPVVKSKKITSIRS